MCENFQSTQLPPPPPLPIAADLGGTKADTLILFEKFLNNGKPEQIAAYRDDNPILMEVLKVFNKTIQTQIRGYLAHKAMLISNDTECDQTAVTKADTIMQSAFDDTTECVITFRQRVRAEVSPSIKNIREVITKIRSFCLKILYISNIKL